MERLTTKTSIMGRKHDLAYGYASIWKKKLLKNYRYDLIEEAVDKLGQLEDLEEELGIDLLTLFKALKNGIWYKGHKDIYFVKGVCLDLVGEFFELWVEGHKILDGIQIRLKDYGKTWSLRKEDLEDE